MSRKDFRMIAVVISTMPKQYRASVACLFALTLPRTNPKFKVSKFLEACGVSVNSSGLKRARYKIATTDVLMYEKF